MTLLPNATILNDGWVVNTGTAHDALDDDNGDTSYISTTSNGKRVILGFADPTVAEGDIDFGAGISIRFTSSGRCPSRGFAGSDVDIKFQTPSGFTETINYFNNRSYETENGTARTTKPDSSAWSYSDLEDLEMRCTKNGTANVRLSYLALEVTYTEAAVAADNATFFGANF
jgi:hypothetical protein|tara:strand:- start:702 stop:1217 length:516 start_codon:yes stop_codon:yes gene_type:complete